MAPKITGYALSCIYCIHVSSTSMRRSEAGRDNSLQHILGFSSVLQWILLQNCWRL